MSHDGSTGLGEASLVAFFGNCPHLRYLHISGDDKVAGKVKGPALDELREKPGWGKELEKLRLTDQRSYDKSFVKAIKSLSALRGKKVAIEVGDTHERSVGVSTWLGGKQKWGY